MMVRATTTILATVTMFVIGCGTGSEEDGLGTAEAPLCEVPADIACPHGEQEVVKHYPAGGYDQGPAADVTFCGDGQGALVLLAVRTEGPHAGDIIDWFHWRADGGELVGSTSVSCWPAGDDGEQIVARRVEADNVGTESECFGRDGVPNGCSAEDVTTYRQSWLAD